MTALQSVFRNDPRHLKLAAIVLLAVPAVALLLLAVGELLDGDESGLQHVPEAAVLVAIAWFAWKRPRSAGILLVAATAVFFIAWLVFVDVGEMSWPGRLIAMLLLFVPPLIAAWLLLRAGQGSGR
jgi:peptidoglycan/LPS O-acetylase OafA/YrhL